MPTLSNDMKEKIIEFNTVSKSFGDNQVLKNLSFDVAKSEKLRT